MANIIRAAADALPSLNDAISIPAWGIKYIRERSNRTVLYCSPDSAGFLTSQFVISTERNARTAKAAINMPAVSFRENSKSPKPHIMQI